jgi:hypothetical protein
MITRLFPCVVVLSLAGCGSGNLPPSAGPSEKIEGPDVKTLSHDALMAVLHECHQYGSSDDPRVKYTIAYCSAVQSAHAMEGYANPGAGAVDPSLTKLH